MGRVVTATRRHAPDRRVGGAFHYRLGWGHDGLEELAAGCDVIVVVDVLRFSSAVSAAVEAGASVAPMPWREPGTGELPDRTSGTAAAAAPRDRAAASLSPTELLRARPDDAIVVSSPNGAALAVEAGERDVPFVLAGCLRNATATARRALIVAHDAPIGIVAAGERWPGPAGRLRPAVEDLIGAGAVLHALDPAGSVSAPCCDPEARAARAAFLDARPSLPGLLAATMSGQELIDGGRGDDVATCAALDATDLAAQLIDGRFVGV